MCNTLVFGRNEKEPYWKSHAKVDIEGYNVPPWNRRNEVDEQLFPHRGGGRSRNLITLPTMVWARTTSAEIEARLNGAKEPPVRLETWDTVGSGYQPA